MKNVYISGPVSHFDLEERRAAFATVEERIINLGHKCTNPMKNGVPADAHWSQHMRVDIGLLLSCDAIYMMKGWEQSERCRLELNVASSIGLPVFFENVIKRHHLKDAIFDKD